jgi:hypothetical protein
MFQPVRFLLALVLVSQLFFACKKDDEVTPVQPGTFVISTQANQTSANSEFDLGDLFSSDDFIFMLANSGDETIFNTTLSSNNPAFDVNIKNIQTLSKSSPALITIDITHGVPLKGVGKVPNLPQGENKATITLKGKTLSGKDTVVVIKEFIVKVNAKVMDAKILSGGIDAIKDTTAFKNLIVAPSKTVKLVNTGNVLIKASISYTKVGVTGYLYPTGEFVEYLDPAKGYIIQNEIELQPGESKDISDLISPITGKRMEGDIKFFYAGLTTITLSTKEAVFNINALNLSTQ